MLLCDNLPHDDDAVRAVVADLVRAAPTLDAWMNAVVGQTAAVLGRGDGRRGARVTVHAGRRDAS